MIETIFEKGINTVSRHVIGTLGCKVNHQQPAFRIFANQKPNCLSIVFAEKHPGAFSNCCETSCYINVNIVKHLWWHGYNGHRMMDARCDRDPLLCSAALSQHKHTEVFIRPGPRPHTNTVHCHSSQPGTILPQSNENISCKIVWTNFLAPFFGWN